MFNQFNKITMLQLKHIDDNLYLVDTEVEIKTGDYYLHDVCNISTATKEEVDENILKYCKKIIAQHKDQLSGVPLFTLPEEKVDAEKLADLIYPHSRKFISVAIENSILKVGFIAGYNRCLSDNKERKYTEADIRTAFMHGCKSERQLKPRFKCLEDYIQSITTPNLQQYDGKEVEIEMCTDTVISGGLYSNIPPGLKHHEVEIPRLINEKITITKIK